MNDLINSLFLELIEKNPQINDELKQLHLVVNQDRDRSTNLIKQLFDEVPQGKEFFL